MAINKINNYSQLDSNILELQLTSDCSFIGKHNVSLTNYDNTSESQIAAGSIIEVGGALYKVTTDTAISGSPSDGTVYIYMVPSGVTLIPTYTNTAPTWDNEKNGWYGTGASANYRYLEYMMTLASSVWSNKEIFVYDTNINSLGVTTWTKKIDGRARYVNYLHSSSSTLGALYTALDAYIPEVGDIIKLCGGMYCLTKMESLARAERTSENQITVYSANSAGVTAIAFGSGSSTAIIISVSW